MHTLLLHEKVKVYKDILKFVSLNQIIEKVSIGFILFSIGFILYNVVLVSYNCHTALVMCSKSGF